MSLNRTYNTWEMGFVPDDVATYDGTFFYTYTGAPSWFNIELITTGRWFPSYSFTPPHGTSGTFTITVLEFYSATGLLNSSGTITINVQTFENAPWEIDLCHVVSIIWLDPSGGWESYMFSGKQQATQGKGKSATHINSVGEKRFTRKDDIYQGVIATTGKVLPFHADYIADAFKSIQAFLVFDDSGAIPIIIDPRSFKKVPNRGEKFSQYEFSFTHAVEDVIQTQ